MQLLIAFCREYQDTIRAMPRNIEPHGAAKVTADFFLHYSPLFTFIDYGLFRHLISEFGSDTLKLRIAEYVAEVEQFKKETTVAEVMDIWPGNTNIRLNYTKLRAKLILKVTPGHIHSKNWIHFDKDSVVSYGSQSSSFGSYQWNQDCHSLYGTSLQ